MKLLFSFPEKLLQETNFFRLAAIYIPQCKPDKHMEYNLNACAAL